MDVATFQHPGRRGRRHGYQHDRFVVHRSAKGAVFAVFDGHGTYAEGHLIAEYCARHFVQLITQTQAWQKSQDESDVRDDELVDALKRVVAQLEKDANPGPGLDNYAGTTLCAIVIKHGWLYTVNVGDSRALLAQRAPPTNRVHTPLLTTVQLTTDHSCTNPEEKKRIEAAGGWVQDGRLNGRLDMSRSIGDYDYKHYRMEPRFNPGQHHFDHTLLSAEPDVTARKLTEDDVFLIIASDGLWAGNLSNDSLVIQAEAALALQHPLDQVAKQLVQFAVLEGQSHDNLSVVFVKLRELPQRQNLGWFRRGKNERSTAASPRGFRQGKNSELKQWKMVFGRRREDSM